MAVSESKARRLDWEGAWNARDLGGYPTRDGGQTCWGSIARSDDPARLTEAGRAAVVEHGIRTIIDLRMPKELEESPNPFAAGGTHGILYKNISFIDPAAGMDDSAGSDPDTRTLAGDYISMLDRFVSQVGQVMNAIAEAPDGPVLIHCMAGKDRTGLISALLLDLAGVPEETVAADYALTAELLRPHDEEWLENGPGERADREAMLEKYLTRDDVMLEVLEHLDARYGGVEPYLKKAGVSEEDISRLRRRLVPLR